MKKILLSAILGIAALTAGAQDYTTVTLDKTGNLENVLIENKATTAAYLKIVCAEGASLNNADFTAIRANLRSTLKGLDLSDASVITGTTPNAIPNGGLEAMINLETITLPEGLIGTGTYTFNICYNLRNIYLPNSLLYIREGAFQGCEKLQISSLPESLVEVNDNAFYCQANIEFTGAGYKYTCTGGMVGMTASVLPEGITVIGDDAFNGTGVSFKEFPLGLTSIGTRAFRNTNVSFTQFPDNLETLGTAAFVNCYNVTVFHINLPESANNTIPNQTFYITDPKTRVFYCESTTPPTANSAESGFTAAFGVSWYDSSDVTTTIYVPAEAVEAYKSTLPYSKMIVLPLEEEEESDDYGYYLVGSMTGEFQPNNSYKFSKADDDTYTLTVGSISKEDQFEVAYVSNGEITYYGPQSVTTGVQNGSTVDLQKDTDNTTYITMESGLLNVTFTLTADATSATSLKIEGEVNTTDWVITPGNDQTMQSGTVTDSDIVLVTVSEGALAYIYAPTALEGTTVYYEVTVNGGTDLQTAAESRVAATITDGYFTVPLVKGNSGAINVYEDATTDEPIATFTYTVSSTGVPTGVEAVETTDGEAEYFNLQGVKVAYPDKGIYIKVQNGKVTKIVK